MSERMSPWPIILVLLISPMVAAAQPPTLDVALEYLAAALAIDREGEYSDVRLPGSELLPRVGAPALPMRAEQVILPEGTVARSARVISRAAVRIPCGPVRPFQPPTILGRSPAMVPADAAIYEGSALYPEELGVFRGTGNMGGLRIASCEIHPVQYDPATQEIIVHTDLLLTFDLEPDGSVGRREVSPGEGLCRLARAGMHGTDNFAQTSAPGRGHELDPDAYQYVIITHSTQSSAYEPYAAWKTAKGVPATVVTVEWIAATYPGRDLAEKVRNFIIAAVNQWGTAYVLLGGDSQIVPTRVAWAFDCEAGGPPDENDLHADLYFADLDGTWDANGNGIFGEVADSVDLYPDILVGRAPSENLAEAQAMVNKFLTYERTAPAGRTMEAFFFAEILWENPYTDSGIGKDMIGERYFAAYEPIERQYESLGNESDQSVLAYLNSGPHLTNHGGHAFTSVMGTGNGYISLNEASSLTNAPYFFVLYSIGCWAGAVDYDCMGERFADNPNGGTIAFVGNSRYGWGSPGNPGWGYSETFDSDFYGAILSEGLTQFGAALNWPKILRVPYAQDENVYRWHEYQVNLFGDPEMACHTAEILPLAVDAPATIPLGATQFTVTVTDPGGPVAGARVCVKGPELYAAGATDTGGQIVFAADLQNAQSLTITATAANHPGVQREVIAAGSDAFLTVTGVSIDDDNVAPSAGNGDGEIGAGETIELFVTLHNYGGEDCLNVTGTLSGDNPYATVIAATAQFGTISAGGEATNTAPLVFAVNPGCPADECLLFSLLAEDNAGGSWELQIPLTVVAPGPRFCSYALTELSGNGDGIADPGETVALSVRMRNGGSGNLSPLDAVLTTSDMNLSILQSVAATYVQLEPGESAVLEPAFELQINPGCPPTSYGELELAFVHDEGTASDRFLLAIGEPGLRDDLESGEGEWTHSGTNDLWHLTEYRSHSSSHSWYCGTQAHTYLNNTDARLVSPAFVAPIDAELSFWCYFSVTTYGVDGLFVEVWNDGQWETVTYLGSGGALGDSLLFVCDWTENVCRLEGLEPGSTTQVRFRFVTDGADTDEGFYIDDVCIRSAGFSQVEGPRNARALLLTPAGARPVSETARWSLQLDAPARVAAAVYDPAGRLVAEILRTSLPAGAHDLIWQGTATPDGIYFLKVAAGERVVTRRIVKLRR